MGWRLRKKGGGLGKMGGWLREMGGWLREMGGWLREIFGRVCMSIDTTIVAFLSLPSLFLHIFHNIVIFLILNTIFVYLVKRRMKCFL
jgi:hypothetical protein